MNALPGVMDALGRAHARLLRQQEALFDAQRSILLRSEELSMHDQVLALFADSGDAKAVARTCAERGWQVNDVDGLRLFTPGDVLTIVEWDGLPGNPVLRTLAQQRLARPG
ncbi:MAG: hypothetical protein C0423_13920 [Methylibium sp.]|nr:hypothetical protein [Methylibium sp.]